ncbi:MAG: PAS domain-containing protein [Burkholderiaceae bacterium]
MPKTDHMQQRTQTAGVSNAAEMRFSTMFEQAPFSAQLIAPDGRTLQVNRAWQDLWCINGEDALMQYILTEYNILEDPQLKAKGITDALRRAIGGESVVIPAVLYDPAELGHPGKARWVTAHAHPIKDEAGQVREVMLMHVDVTDRMRDEAALRTSEGRLKQLANTIPQMAWMADPEGSIHWYNDRWYEFTGTTLDQVKHSGWQQVHDPRVLPQVLDAWRRSIATGESFQMTFPLRGKDGRFRSFLTLVAPLKDASGKVLQWFGTNTDVTPMEQAEEERHRTEERLWLATEAGDIGIWDWDFKLDQITWSDRMYRLHGVDPADFGGRSADFVALVHPDDKPALWEKVEAAIREGDGFSAEFRAMRNGVSIWLSSWARVHRDPSGVATRLVGATISIDSYKKAEAALRESDKRKDDFLAMLAHELRNPLAPITTAAQLLRRSQYDEQRVRVASEIIARQARHMTELIDDLLDVSRVTRGLVELSRDQLDIGPVIADAVEQVRPMIDERNHTLTVPGDMPMLMVGGDRTRLVQVIVNLLNNAAKYTPPGGRIHLDVRHDATTVQIVVRDNGLGIHASLLPHIFALFSQATRTPDRSQGGLGVGLALVKSIVELHRGAIDAHSDGPGHGSVFTLTLPLSASPPKPCGAEAVASTDDAPDRSLDVMLVDDNRDAADLLAELLRMAGHRVTVQYDVHDALRHAQRQPPQVFILDIGLPGMDGFELARQLRQQTQNADAFYIALSGYGQAHDREQSRAAGFAHHLAKPVEVGELETILRGIG